MYFVVVGLSVMPVNYVMRNDLATEELAVRDAGQRLPTNKTSHNLVQSHCMSTAGRAVYIRSLGVLSSHNCKKHEHYSGNH